MIIIIIIIVPWPSSLSWSLVVGLCHLCPFVGAGRHLWAVVGGGSGPWFVFWGWQLFLCVGHRSCSFWGVCCCFWVVVFDGGPLALTWWQGSRWSSLEALLVWWWWVTKGNHVTWCLVGGLFGNRCENKQTNNWIPAGIRGALIRPQGWGDLSSAILVRYMHDNLGLQVHLFSLHLHNSLSFRSCRCILLIGFLLLLLDSQVDCRGFAAEICSVFKKCFIVFFCWKCYARFWKDSWYEEHENVVVEVKKMGRECGVDFHQ